MAFVRPETGESFWLLVPRIATDVYRLAVAAFAQAIGVGPDKAGVHLEFLPAYSPELQPVERLWALIDEELANQVLPDLETLFDRLSVRCQVVRTWTQTIARRTCFHWWPRLALPSGQ